MFGVHDWTFLYNMFDVQFINNILITIKSNDFLGHSSRVGFVSMWKGLCYPKCANAGCLVAQICTVCDFHFFVKSSEQIFFSEIFYICCCYTFPVFGPYLFGSCHRGALDLLLVTFVVHIFLPVLSPLLPSPPLPLPPLLIPPRPPNVSPALRVISLFWLLTGRRLSRSTDGGSRAEG